MTKKRRNTRKRFRKKRKKRFTRKKRGGAGETCSIFNPCKADQVCSHAKTWYMSGWSWSLLPRWARGVCRDKWDWELKKGQKENKQCSIQ